MEDSEAQVRVELAKTELELLAVWRAADEQGCQERFWKILRREVTSGDRLQRSAS